MHLRKVRDILASEDIVFGAARTGVASSKDGVGARAMDSLLKTMGGGPGRNPEAGETARSLQRLFARRMLLITDEIRMVGSQRFAAVSIRPGEAKINPDICGGMGVVLCGGFSQIRPLVRRLYCPRCLETGREWLR